VPALYGDSADEPIEAAVARGETSRDTDLMSACRGRPGAIANCDTASRVTLAVVGVECRDHARQHVVQAQAMRRSRGQDDLACGDA
jgi:hypothetical protein